MTSDYDIAIIGGGMTGASLACCLLDKSLRIAVIEQIAPGANLQPSYDDRGLALTLSSQRLLNAINVWKDCADRANPIRHIHISDQGKFGLVHLHAADVQLPAIGHVVVARELGKALLNKITTHPEIEFICPATVTAATPTNHSVKLEYNLNGQLNLLTCKLLVVADGTHSRIREQLGLTVTCKDYGQTAIVANISTTGKHHQTAFERFTHKGPLALLPMEENKCVSVYTVPTLEKDHYLGLDESSYLQKIQHDFGKRLGQMTRVGARKSYPLQLVLADRQFTERAVLLGNAAHTIHPNGAQGFNLGLRDAAALAEHIIAGLHSRKDPGHISVLENYCQSREQDQSQIIRFTDTVARLFYTTNPLKTLFRNLGMTALDMSPTLKQEFMRQATGIVGKQPVLVRQTIAGSV